MKKKRGCPRIKESNSRIILNLEKIYIQVPGFTVTVAVLTNGSNKDANMHT
jgi:hypothetical protein